MAESEEELISFLMKVKEESEKVGLKLNVQKMKIMTSSPIISWQTDGETLETVTNFIFLASKITVDGDCSHEIKRCLLPGRRAMTSLDSILKSRDITLLTRVRIVKSYGFSSSHVQMWELDHKEGWAPKNWYVQTVVLEKTLESPSDGTETKPVNPEGNQAWIFIRETDPEGEASVLGSPDAKSQLTGKDSCWERLRAGGEGADRGWDGWMASPTQWTWVWETLGDGERRGWHAVVHGVLKEWDKT